MLTLTTASGLTGNSIASEMTRPPAGIVKLVWPEKVTACKVSGWITGVPCTPLSGRAIVTSVIDRSVIPKTFDRRNRNISPPIDTRNVWRSVELRKNKSPSFYAIFSHIINWPSRCGTWLLPRYMVWFPHIFGIRQVGWLGKLGHWRPCIHPMPSGSFVQSRTVYNHDVSSFHVCFSQGRGEQLPRLCTKVEMHQF